MANTNAFKIKNGLDLGAYNKDISDTAVDVFVYDTSKDSDGGAWRKRTQGTSWYNETLNTSTRGSRKEFPAVAVIVAESSQVTIYDGDDPDLPMWMVFNQVVASPAYEQFWRGTRPATGVFSLNGMLIFSVNSASVAGVQVSNFASDELRRYSDNSTYSVIYSLPVSGRNSTSNPVKSVLPFIVSPVANDVAMTVLPNAPIDAATGLPVPTIGIATNGGVSVIRDDGTVVDITQSSASYTETNYVVLSEEGTVTLAYNNSGGLEYGWVYTLNIPSFDTVITINAQSPAFSWFDTRNPLSFNQDFWISNNNGTDGVKLSAMASKFPKLAFGTSTALTNTVDNLGTEPYLFNYITSDYNTGWMNGAIKLATLSDTDDTDVTGSELVTNGTFDSDVSGWTARNSDATLSHQSGQLRVENANAALGEAYQSISLTAGVTYTFSANITAINTSHGQFYLGTGTTGTSSTVAGTQHNTTGVKSFTYTPTSSGTYYIILGHRGANVAGYYAQYDNISARVA